MILFWDDEDVIVLDDDDDSAAVDGLEMWDDCGGCGDCMGASGDLGVGGWATLISMKKDLSTPSLSLSDADCFDYIYWI